MRYKVEIGKIGWILCVFWVSVFVLNILKYVYKVICVFLCSEVYFVM